MQKETVNETRRQIASLWASGYTVSQIARELGVSRPTVYKVVRLLDNPEASLQDGRTRNSGRPPTFDAEVRETIKLIRSKHPQWGPVFIQDYIRRHNLLPQVPSIRTIADIINELGLARKPIGPKDKRAYPVERVLEPGSITLDLWGPWHLRATKIYLVTCQDRWTRLALAVPSYSVKYGDSEAMTTRGVQENLWSTAIMAHYMYHCPSGTLRRVYCDNGVGMVPAFGHLPAPVKLALCMGATVTYIPPAQPWRNGRLERFHWTLAREYWHQQRPTKIEEAERGLVEYLNWYNHQRIHSSLAYMAPAQMLDTPIEPLPERFWEEAAAAVPDLKALPPSEISGTIECIRLVDNQGVVKLWQGQTLQLQPVLAGQYVRVEFMIDGIDRTGVGRVVWRGREEIVVAEFTHRLGVGYKQKETLVMELRFREFGASELPRNQRYDEVEYAHGEARRLFGPRPTRSE